MRILASTIAEGRTYRFDGTFVDEDVADMLDASLAEPLTVSLQYTMVERVVYLRIAVQGKVHARCDLCGAACIADCCCTLDEELTESSDCYDPVDDGYDLDPLVRQAIVLSAPREVKCRPDCRGLCPVCGGNLNLAQCTCLTDKPRIGENNPFAALQDIFTTGGAKNGSTKM